MCECVSVCDSSCPCVHCPSCALWFFCYTVDTCILLFCILVCGFSHTHPFHFSGLLSTSFDNHSCTHTEMPITLQPILNPSMRARTVKVEEKTQEAARQEREAIELAYQERQREALAKYEKALEKVWHVLQYSPVSTHSIISFTVFCSRLHNLFRSLLFSLCIVVSQASFSGFISVC
jgi:hypothetical protein